MTVKLADVPAVVVDGKPLTAKELRVDQSAALISTETVPAPASPTTRSGKPSRLKSPTATGMGTNKLAA